MSAGGSGLENRLEMYRYDRPEETIPAAQREQFITNMTQIAQQGFGTGITETDVAAHVMPVECLYVISDAEDPVGFAAFDTLQVDSADLLFLHGIVLRPDYQKKGIFRTVVAKALQVYEPAYLAMRTQNPVVYAAAQKMVRHLYPDGGMIPERIQRIGGCIAAHLGMERFDPNTMVGRRTYQGCLYSRLPDHSAGKYVFASLGIDTQHGDSVMLIGGIQNEDT
ncbi:MAG: GNAT family N-acetyltransferase [Nanoarchaeota archaeon]